MSAETKENLAPATPAWLGRVHGHRRPLRRRRSPEDRTPDLSVVPPPTNRSHLARTALEYLVAACVSCPALVGLDAGWVAASFLVLWSVPLFRDTTHPGARPVLSPLFTRVLVALGGYAVALTAGLVGPHTSRPVMATLCAAATAVAAVRLVAGRRPVTSRVLVVAGSDVLEDSVERWRGMPATEVVGTFELPGPGPDGEHDPAARAHACALIAATAGSVGADLVAVDGRQPLPEGYLRALSWSLEGTGATLALSGDLDGFRPHRLAAVSVGGQLLLTVGPRRASRGARLTKAVLDRVVAAVLAVVAAPVVLTLAALVRLDSPGPAIYKQVRIGLHGRPFVMYKLRTMCADADRLRPALTAIHPQAYLFKLREDPRLTRVGRLLRRTSLDELPQLWNVLRGDMSLIGPRPALPEEFALNRDGGRRVVVKPGLTGAWQVSGRSELSPDASVALDLDYIDNWRLRDDLRIALRTVDAVVSGRGAY